ncbi:MAG: hypothetical protein JWP09_172 [Candidatus Taylorbacteria bacterium]|nr:hypothetical protein [Candidatus Taylorbacteria bacterium]
MQNKYPKILFVCKGNMYRSQMAEAIAAKIIGKENVKSAGTYTGAADEPEGLVLKDLSTIFKTGYENFDKFLLFMKERGCDIGENKTKKVTEDLVDWADIVIDMAEDPYDLELLQNSKKVTRFEIPNDGTKCALNYENEHIYIEKLINSHDSIKAL